MRKFKFYCLFICLLGLTTFVQAQNSDLKQKLPIDKNVRIGKLDNGLTYYIRKNTKPENRLELRLVVNAGSILENDNQLGLAHFTEHMAFNGSKNFTKNELVDYLQSVGVKFGADLNAYTSFDETVYILPIPSDDDKIVEKGFTILEDWAGGLTFDDQEIDKERGVVIEEWRLGQGADRRMLDSFLPVLYRDSRYAKRLPIGTKNTLETFEYQTIKQFYKDWYRPDLMAVVAVGDLEPDEIEKKIKAHFSNLKNPENPRKRENFQVPDHNETLIKVATDKEAAFTRIYLFHKKNPEKIETLADFRKYMLYQFFSGMLNERLNELRQKAEPPFIFGGVYYGTSWARTKNAYQAYAVVSQDGIENGLKTLLTENERVKQHGFTNGELERYKKNFLTMYQKAYSEKDKTESERYTDKYKDHFLEGTPMTGIEFSFKFVQGILPTIKLDEINSIAKELIREDNRVVVVTAPEKEGVKVPSEAEIKMILEASKSEKIEPYEDKLGNAKLMETTPKAGKITAEKSYEKVGITELILSNGIKVLLKKTDFKNDEILMSAYSAGGHSLYSDDDYQSADNAGSIIGNSGLGEFSNVDLEKLLAGKNVAISPYISELEEGFSGSCRPEDLETLLQLTHLSFTKPRKDKDAHASFINRQKSVLQNISSNPQYYFYDQSARFMAQGNLRHNGIPTSEDMDKINLDRVFEIYQERFKNAGDFTFFLVGNFDEAKLKPLLETYLGSLPSEPKKETWKNVGINPPTGKHDKIFYKGSDPKSMVRMIFSGEYKYEVQTNYAMEMLAQILSIKLIEQIREEKGGVYGIGASSQTEKFPEERYSVTISFPCAPENVEDLSKAVLDEIEKLRKSGAEEKDMKKVLETMRREHELDLKKNKFWLGVLKEAYVHEKSPEGILKHIENAEKVTSKDIQNVVKKYMNGKNYIRLVLKPETK